MKILSIETSCDETAISLVEASGGLESPLFTVLGNSLFSQIELHQQYGGVFPALARREHAKNLTPILEKVITEAKILIHGNLGATEDSWEKVREILKKEDGLYEDLRKLAYNIQKPEIDVICVTSGPGLEPALWVGISFAIALGELWGLPVVSVNHMEGHIYSVLTENSDARAIRFPALALLISGGHTELVHVSGYGKYKIVGKTLDDAVGEAYDKTARMLGLTYPGGPEISKLSEYARTNSLPQIVKLPRPMLHSHTLDFSFSGLKTSVLYYLRDHYGFGGENPVKLSLEQKADIAREIDESVKEVLLTKTKKALNEYTSKTLIVAGGVIGNQNLRQSFQELEKEYSDLTVKVPTKSLSTDNALMIACAGYIKISTNPNILTYPQQIRANGNLSLE